MKAKPKRRRRGLGQTEFLDQLRECERLSKLSIRFPRRGMTEGGREIADPMDRSTVAFSVSAELRDCCSTLKKVATSPVEKQTAWRICQQARRFEAKHGPDIEAGRRGQEFGAEFRQQEGRFEAKHRPDIEERERRDDEEDRARIRKDWGLGRRR